MCSYESIINGTLDLADVALMNEMIDVQAENQARMEDAARLMNGNR